MAQAGSPKTRWPTTSLSFAYRLLLCLCAALTPSFASGQEGVVRPVSADDTSGNSYLLSFGLNHGDIQTLIAEKPLRGLLRPGQVHTLQFAVQEVNDTLPDVLLTLRTVGAGDSDLHCLSLESLTTSGKSVGPQHNVWWSNHTSGKDYVFLSPKHPQYAVLSLTVANGAKVVRGAAFSCAVTGTRFNISNSRTEFELSLELDYTQRGVATEEKQIMSSMFKKCCESDEACVPWRDGPQDVCHLLGCVCDRSGHLIRIRMQGFGLKCSFPSQEISKLTRLEKLELGWNDISGDIDSIVQKLQAAGSAIEHFGLSNNALTSTMFLGASNRENLNFCTIVKGRLSYLDLRNNRIARELSPCLFFPESNLEELHLSGNPLIGRNLPDGFTSKSKIRVINMANTGIIGKIPESLGKAPLLQLLDLSGNELAGRIPKSLGRSPTLEFVNLARNRIGGRIPSSLAKSNTLRVLWLSGNALTQLPKEWNGRGEASSALVDVILAGNRIQGEFPSPLARAKSLLRLHIGGNRMTGRLPNKIGLFPRAVYIDIGNNMFDGPFPLQWAEIGMFSFLSGAQNRKTLIHRDTEETIISVLDVSNNNLSGLLPRFLVDAFASGQVKVFLAGNAGIVCSHLVRASCEKYFGKEPNVKGQIAEKDPTRVDNLYVVPDNSDTPQRQRGPSPRSAPPTSGSSKSSFPLIIAAVLIGSVTCLILIAIIVCRIATRGTKAGEYSWSISSNLGTHQSGVLLRQSTDLSHREHSSGPENVPQQSPRSRSPGPSSSRSDLLAASPANVASVTTLNPAGHVVFRDPRVPPPPSSGHGGLLAARGSSVISSSMRTAEFSLSWRLANAQAPSGVPELSYVSKQYDGGPLPTSRPVLVPSLDGAGPPSGASAEHLTSDTEGFASAGSSDGTQESIESEVNQQLFRAGGKQSLPSGGGFPSASAAGEVSSMGLAGGLSPSLEGWLKLASGTTDGSASGSANGNVSVKSQAENKMGLVEIQE